MRYIAVAPYAVGALFFAALVIGIVWLFVSGGDGKQLLSAPLGPAIVTFSAAAVYLARETWRRLSEGAPLEPRALAIAAGVPLAIGAVAILFYGFLAFVVSWTSPASHGCSDKRDVLRSVGTDARRWEFIAPSGNGQGSWPTETFTVGEDWSITWSRDQGELSITLYDPLAHGFIEIAHDDGASDQLAPSTQTRDLTRAGTYCLTIDSIFISGNTADTSKRTNWKVAIEDHR